MSDVEYMGANGGERPANPQGRSSTEAAQHAEGPVAKTIEDQTAKIPSDAFLWAAGASIFTALALQAIGRKAESTFIGQWAPTILILGLYNKLVKVAGSDRTSV